MNRAPYMRSLTSPAGARRTAAGFTLIELMIAIVVLTILVGVGLPSFLQMLRNAEIRNAAETIVSGIQRARAEAVARNANMQFVLSAGSTSWTVDYVSKPVSTDPAIDRRTATEGSANVAISAEASDGTTPVTTVSFNNVGQVVTNADASKSLSKIVLTATGGNQTLWVTIGAGGNARSCDPSLTAGSSARAC